MVYMDLSVISLQFIQFCLASKFVFGTDDIPVGVNIITTHEANKCKQSHCTNSHHITLEILWLYSCI